MEREKLLKEETPTTRITETCNNLEYLQGFFVIQIQNYKLV
jgi:hypothetical protein